VDSINDPFATITSKAKFGLIKVKSQYYKIVDIGMRMLTPRELYNAQGFPPDYIIDKVNGKKYPIAKQIARCGNAVPPPFAEALVRANLPFDCASKNIASMQQLLNYNEQLKLV
jgi:DNA (cytosine-5)-methyltransferase 1